MFLGDYLDRKGILDEDHKFIRDQFNAFRQEKDSTMLYEYLPTLFAVDVSDWMQETGNKLVVFLDNYESLVGATNVLTPEQLKRDLWLRSQNGLIYMIPNTLWTIAGRNQLHWSGELADELEQHLIKALSPEDSNLFLKKAGIVDENLRGKLIELTGGYPIFLGRVGKLTVKLRCSVLNVLKFWITYFSHDGAAADVGRVLATISKWVYQHALKVRDKIAVRFSERNHKVSKSLGTVNRHGVINRGAHTTDRTMTLDAAKIVF